MKRDGALDLLLAASFVSSVKLGFALGFLPISLVALLVALGAMWGRRLGRLLASAALGLVLAKTGLPTLGEAAPTLDTGRPVDLVGQIDAHPRRGSFGCTARVEASTLRQGSRMLFKPGSILLSLPDAACERLRLGETWRARGYLRGPRVYRNLRPIETGTWRLSVKSMSFLEEVEAGGTIASWSTRWRRRVEDGFAGAESGVGDSRGLALARALVLGDIGALSDSERRGFRRLGLSHLVAVSGLHLVLIATGAAWLGRALSMKPRLLLSAGAMLAYALVVGPQPSLLRALVMAAVAHAALLLERPPSSRRGLALAAAGLVAIQPRIVDDLGFELTLAATAGLVLIQPLLAERWRRYLGWVSGPLAASVAAELAVLPFILPRFFFLTPLAALANLGAVPWCGVMLGASLVWVCCELASPAFAGSLVPVLDRIAAPGLALAEWRGAIPWLIPLRISWLAAALAAFLLGYACLVHGRRLRSVALVAALLLLGWHHPAFLPRPSAPEVVALDVGQGDATLIRSGRQALLIDGGGWSTGDFAAAVLVPALLDEGVSKLDAVVVSHDDSDHCRGLLDLTDYLPIDEAWTSRALDGGCTDAVVRNVASRRGGKRHRELALGDRLSWRGWRVSVLWPPPGVVATDNESSLVLRFESDRSSVLFTGDAGFRTERELVHSLGGALASDVLKVGHHGSRGSSSKEFLRAVAPTWALVSVGAENRYGHPSTDALSRLETSRATILRTDRHGALRMVFPPGRGPLWRQR